MDSDRLVRMSALNQWKIDTHAKIRILLKFLMVGLTNKPEWKGQSKCLTWNHGNSVDSHPVNIVRLAEWQDEKFEWESTWILQN